MRRRKHLDIGCNMQAVGIISKEVGSSKQQFGFR